MVISLAFGVLFATGVTLILVPCLFHMAEKIIAMWQVKDELSQTTPLEKS
jgi:hypothetical protein